MKSQCNTTFVTKTFLASIMYFFYLRFFYLRIHIYYIYMTRKHSKSIFWVRCFTEWKHNFSRIRVPWPNYELKHVWSNAFILWPSKGSSNKGFEAGSGSRCIRSSLVSYMIERIIIESWYPEAIKTSQERVDRISKILPNFLCGHIFYNRPEKVGFPFFHIKLPDVQGNLWNCFDLFYWLRLTMVVVVVKTTIFPAYK